MITCPKCGQANDGSAMNCTNCHINLQWALENATVIEEGRQRDLEECASSLIVTTTDSIEGRITSEYLGVLAVEELRDSTGEFLGSSDVADTPGVASTPLSAAIRDARQAGLSKLREQAAIIDADAVVGTSIDYVLLSSSLVMVAVRGTAVRWLPRKSGGVDGGTLASAVTDVLGIALGGG